MSTEFPIQSRWSYQSDQPLAKAVRKQIFTHLLESFDRAARNVERDMVDPDQDPDGFGAEFSEDGSGQFDAGQFDAGQFDAGQTDAGQFDAAPEANPANPSFSSSSFSGSSFNVVRLNPSMTESSDGQVAAEEFRQEAGAMRLALGGLFDPEDGEIQIDWNEEINNNTPMEVRFAMDVLVEAVVRTHGAALDAFDRRWAFLRDRVGEKERFDNPLQLVTWVRAVNQIVSGAHVPTPTQVLLFLSLEQELVQSLSFLLFEVNSRLSEAGILPESDGVLGAQSSLGRDHREANTLTEGRPPGLNDETLFNTLCDLLSAWEPTAEERRMGVTGPKNPNERMGTRPLSTQEVFSVLSTLQRWVPKVLEEALGASDGRLARELKDTLLKQAATFGIKQDESTFSENDAKAVDLVDEVFTQNLYERKMHQASRVILAQMLFPSVKAAILNRQWFAQTSHPARKLLDSVTAVCVPGPDGRPLEEDLVRKASETVDRLVIGFNEDVSVFEILAKELQDFVDKKRNGEVAEVDDTRELAQALTQELEKRWAAYRGPASVRDFAIEVGVPHLADLERKQARSTFAWGTTLSALDQLLELKSDKKNPVKIDGAMRATLIRTLMSSGWTGVRAHHRLAEQEDALHQFYVPSARPTVAPIMQEFDAVKLLEEELAQRRNPLREALIKTGVVSSDGSGGTGVIEPLKIAIVKPLSEVLPGAKKTEVRQPEIKQPEIKQPEIVKASKADAIDDSDDLIAQYKKLTSPFVQNENEQAAAHKNKAASASHDAETEIGLNFEGFDAAKMLAGDYDNDAQIQALSGISNGLNPEQQPEQQVGGAVADTQPALAEPSYQPTFEPEIVVKGVAEGAFIEQVARLPREALIKTPAKPVRATPAPTPKPVSALGSNRSGSDKNASDKNGRGWDNAAADAVMLKIMELEVGSASTWINAKSQLCVVKLSWISPISMKYLFVNKEGARVMVVTPDELADMARKGRFFPNASPGEDGAPHN